MVSANENTMQMKNILDKLGSLLQHHDRKYTKVYIWKIWYTSIDASYVAYKNLFLFCIYSMKRKARCTISKLDLSRIDYVS